MCRSPYSQAIIARKMRDVPVMRHDETRERTMTEMRSGFSPLLNSSLIPQHTDARDNRLPTSTL